MVNASSNATLSPLDCAVLDLECNWWTQPVLKDHAIRDQLSISRSQYYRRLRALVDNERAYTYDPLTIARLRRRRIARNNIRIARRYLGFQP